MTPEKPGFWVITGAALVATLAAIEDSEFTVVDGFINTPGDPPPDGWSEDIPPGIAESAQLQIQIDGVSYQVVRSNDEDNQRLPVSSAVFSGSAPSTSTAAGTLSQSKADIDPAKDTEWVANLAPDLQPERATIEVAAEGNERLPINTGAMAGSAASISTAAGTLSQSTADISPDKDVDWVAGLAPPTDPLTPSLQTSDDEVIPVDGTVIVIVDNPAEDDSPLTALAPETLPDITTQAAAGEGNERLPVNPLGLTGSAASTTGSSGVLNAGGRTPSADINPDKDTEWVGALAPPSDPITPSLQAAEDEVLPVDGGVVAAAADEPFEDDSPLTALITVPVPAQVPDQELLPVNPLALTGTASSTGTAAGTLAQSTADIFANEDSWVATLAPLLDYLTPSLAIAGDEVIPVSGAAPAVTAIPMLLLLGVG